MCSGKSRVGQILAEKLKWPHYDTDTILFEEQGKSPGDIIRENGEPFFRSLEKMLVKRVAGLSDAVISTGGGVPLDEENLSELKRNSTLVWLKVSAETVLKRAGNFRSRPLIDPANPLESVKKRLAEREKYYSQASIQIDTDHMSIEKVAEKIISMLSLKIK
jgi:shikimate kinase